MNPLLLFLVVAAFILWTALLVWAVFLLLRLNRLLTEALDEVTPGWQDQNALKRWLERKRAGERRKRRPTLNVRS